MKTQPGVAKAPSVRTALVVDDERHVVELISDALKADGFAVTAALDGPAALRRARASRPDVVVLDVGLPGLDGFEVCRALRKEAPVPIVFVSAKGSEIDRIVGLELGADDYVCKPFSPRELVARVRAVLRRAGVPESPPSMRRVVGDLEIDADRREVTLAGRRVTLKPREFDVLWLFARNEGRVFSREQLIETLWGFDFDGDPRTVDVHIRRIRRAICDPADKPRYLHAVVHERL